MSNLSLPSSSSSSQAVETRSKWTVSPEFGHALLTAMRERTQAGGPLPRLPSLLQLSAAEGRETPNPNSSPVKLDGAERLRMKTRVAIRERNHRFQVVPLRDAGHHSSSDHTPSRDLKSTTVKTTNSPGVAQSNPRRAWKKLPADENTVPMPTSAEGYTKTGTPERARKLSERNKNAHAPEHPSFERPAETSYSRRIGSELPAYDALSSPGNKPLTETSRHNGTIHRSSLRREDCHILHFKSPSLGNLRMKPNLDLELETTPVPQVTCRKRTNTLSAAHDHHHHGHLLATIVDDDRRNLLKKDSVKRHAIYTQSLHIPLHECSNLPLGNVPKISLEESSPLCAFPFRSSIPASRNKPNSASRRSGHASSALGFINVPTESLGFSESTSGSQSSVSSMYSQDELSFPSKAALIETRPLTRLGPLSESGQVGRDSKVGGTPNQHHPIILMLLDEVEKAKQEWSTI